MLGYALTLGDFAGWAAASAVWAVRLTAEERAALAWAALKSLEPEQAEAVAETVFGVQPDPLRSDAFTAAVAEYRRHRRTVAA